MSVGTIHTRSVLSSGLCLGGVGCGGIELWPDGTFRHPGFLNNRPWAGGREGHNYDLDVGDYPDEPAFHPEDLAAILRVRVGDGRPQLRFLLRGHGRSFVSNGNMSRMYKYAVVPAVEAIDYDATFPFCTLTYHDRRLPVRVTLTAWTPFVPHEAETSNTPGVVFDYRIENLGDEPVEASLLLGCRNWAGFDQEACRQEHELRKSAGRCVVRMRGDLDRPKAASSGCQSFFAAPRDDQQLSVIEANPYLENIFYGYYLRGDLDGELVPDFLKRVEYCVPSDASGNGVKKAFISNLAWIALRQEIAAGAASDMRYGLTWYFPNHYDVQGDYVGKWYATRFADSAAVADWLIDNGDELKTRSRRFVDRVLDSSLEERFALSLLDQAAVMAKATWVAENGDYFMWEGLGCCCMNTVDVDHYGSFGTVHLFPRLRATVTDLVRSVQLDNGQIVHGFPMQTRPPITEREYRRWDVNLQFVVGLYRDWKWTGDRAWLDRNYQAARRAFAFIGQLDRYGVGLPYIEGGITYDHWHMKGIVTYMAGLYLTTSHAMEALAREMEDNETADAARAARERGQQAFDHLLWNREAGHYNLYYYRPVGEESGGDAPVHEKGAIAGDMVDVAKVAAASADEAGCDPATGCCPPADPVHGEVRDDGLQTDALNGEGYAGIVGLPRSLDAVKTKATLRAIWQANHDAELQFVANGSYRDGSFPDQWPFSQWQNPWTGSEYYFAAQLFAEGMDEEALRVITDVYDRYAREDMRFNHIECNTHYSRGLAIYAAYDAWLGLDWDQPRGCLRLAPRLEDAAGGTWRAPLLTPACWGGVSWDGSTLRIELDHGSGHLARLELGFLGSDASIAIQHGTRSLGLTAGGAAERGGLAVDLEHEVELAAGDTLVCQVS